MDEDRDGAHGAPANERGDEHDKEDGHCSALLVVGVRDDDGALALVESAPDAMRLAVVDGPLQALVTYWTASADGLGTRCVVARLRVVREEQIRVLSRALGVLENGRRHGELGRLGQLDARPAVRDGYAAGEDRTSVGSA